MFLLVDVHIMTSVTLMCGEDRYFSAKLPNVLNNVSQVGLVEFAYDSNRIVKSDYTQADLVAYFVYNAELDYITSYGNGDLTFPQLLEYQEQISKVDGPTFVPPPDEIKSNDPIPDDFNPYSDEIIYSVLKYKLGKTQIPSATGTMY